MRWCIFLVRPERKATMDEKIYRIENWSVVGAEEDPYTPPEAMPLRLHGFVPDHPTLAESQKKSGEGINTSAITGVSGRIVQCLSRKYRLGKISPDYRKWLRKNRPDWNWKEPIRVVRCTDES
jgi:hypothetical protein